MPRNRRNGVAGEEWEVGGVIVLDVEAPRVPPLLDFVVVMAMYS
jgi:hypothetical protein